MILEFFDDPECPETQVTAIDEQIETPQECHPDNERLYKFTMAIQLLLSGADDPKQFTITAEMLRFIMNALSQALLTSETAVRNDIDCSNKMDAMWKELGPKFSPDDDPHRTFRKSICSGISNGNLEWLLCQLIRDLAKDGQSEEMGGNTYVGGLKLGAFGKRQVELAFA